MLERLFVIDYTEGCGGEYFSNFISSHQGFYSSNPNATDMQSISGSLQKYFNTHSLKDNQWRLLFLQHLNIFLQQCDEKNIKKICVAYHLYKNPTHIQKILDLVPTTRFININVVNNRLPKLDYVRKVLLKKFNKNDLKELQWYTQEFTDQQKILIVQRLKINNLLYVDLHLIKNNIIINTNTRQDWVLNFLSKDSTPPSSDVNILYDDFFINFSRSVESYDKLCNELSISPDYDHLDQLIKRNQTNFDQLTHFVKNFERELELL